MPLIKITQEAIDKGKPMDAGWHLLEVTAFAEGDSKDKGSKNWVFDLRCVDDSVCKDRFTYGRFNSKAPGMLVATGFLPSALDTTVDKEMDFDPEALIGKKLYGNTKADTYEGKIQMRTEEFAPASRPPF